MSVKYYGIEEHELFNFGKKRQSMNNYIRYMLDRTQGIFRYNNLPDTLPEREIELMLQLFGYIGVTEVDGNIYAFRGGLGGEPDVYYRPTIFTVANPALNYSANLKIDEECVIIRNDATMSGLLPMFRRYASLLVEDDISQRMSVINKRAQKLISAMDDRTKESAEIFIDKLENGNLAVIADNSFLDGLRVNEYDKATQGLTELIEIRNYHLASWYNEIGISANLNMKREAINTSEAEINQPSLLPLIDNMLSCRREGLDKVNKMFGLEITVELAGSWKQEEILMEQALEKTKAEIEEIETGLEQIEEPEEPEEPEEIEEQEE